MNTSYIERNSQAQRTAGRADREFRNYVAVSPSYPLIPANRVDKSDCCCGNIDLS